MIGYGSDGKKYDILDGEMLGKGGEGFIYRLCDLPGKICKIFKARDREREMKIEAFTHIQWSEEFKKYLAVPEVMLFRNSDHKEFIGYIMEYAEGYEKLSEIYSETHPLSVYKRAWVAANLCRAAIIVHNECDACIGDFNSKNILVNRLTGDIKIIDVDSMHLKLRYKGQPTTLRCLGLDPMLFMPEILEIFDTTKAKSFAALPKSTETFTKYTDYYCIAFHIHMLLLGQKPYGAALSAQDIKDSVKAPSINSMACSGEYVYSNLHSGTHRPDFYLDFNILSPRLQQLFISTFQNGAADPHMRGTAKEFLEALEEYICDLRFSDCGGYDHYLRKDYRGTQCEWCRVESLKAPRKLHHDDICWMTETELMHLIKVSPTYAPQAHSELGKRMTGKIYRDGIATSHNMLSGVYHTLRGKLSSGGSGKA